MDQMKQMKGKRTLLVTALVLSAWFILNPDPIPMALFVFVAQPLILLVVILYVSQVVKELKERKIM